MLGCIERGRKSQWVDSESSASVSVVRSFRAAEENVAEDGCEHQYDVDGV